MLQLTAGVRQRNPNGQERNLQERNLQERLRAAGRRVCHPQGGGQAPGGQAPGGREGRPYLYALPVLGCGWALQRYSVGSRMQPLLLFMSILARRQQD